MRADELGVEVLLVYGAKLHPARLGKPGIRVTVGPDGSFLLEPVGYLDFPSRIEALSAAADTCHDAGLVVEAGPRRWTRVVRKAPA